MSQVLLDHEEIIALAAQGNSAPTIRRRLQLPVSTRQVERIISKYRTVRYEGGLLIDVYPPGPYRALVLQLLEERGRDAKRCDGCGKRQWKPCAVTWTPKEAVTLDDLKFHCPRCLPPAPVGSAGSPASWPHDVLEEPHHAVDPA